MKKRIFGILFACVLVLSLVGVGPAVFADPGSTPYPGYTGDPYTRDPTELITEEQFGNEWVNTTLKGPKGIQCPWEHHGYIAGSPAQLTPYDGPEGIYDYFAQLAAGSPNVAMWDIGETPGYGLPMYIVAISSANTIANLDKYQENLQNLADPRKLGYPENEAAADAAAENLIASASKLKPIYWILAAIHSTETGSREMVMELAYRLAVENREPFKEIRDNVIVFITDPNPDGTEMVANWDNFYMNDPYWRDREPSPPFYNFYTQHDNNRDTHTNSQPEQLALVQAYNEWPAQVMLDIHQSMFLLYTFNGMEPTFPSIDPITQTEWQWIAARELNQMEQFGHPGVWTYRYVNMYYPMYQIQMANLRSGTGGFYEVYGWNYPSTRTRNVGTGSRTWYWYSPMPYKESRITWSFRDNINYSQTAALTRGLTIARNRDIILRNYWVKAKKAVSAPGTTEIGCSGYFTYPYAYVVPSVQKDMPDTVRMINNLLDNGVEIHTADSEFTIGDTTYPAGSFILSLAQPASRFVYAMFDVQFWPEDMPAPYDATAWQYDLMRDVACDRIEDPAIYAVPMTLIVDEQIDCPYSVSDEISAGYYVIDHNSINNIVTLVFALDKDGYECYAAEGSEGVIDVGDVLIPAEQAGVYEALESLVQELGLTMHSVAETAVAMHELNVPRVAMYHCWRNVQEGGWSRFTFEQFIPKDDEGYYKYEVIQREDVLAGNLKDKYDVIFLPDGSGSSMVAGTSPGSAPEEVWYGPVQTTQRTGGLGAAGVAELKEFVDAGGLLILNNASTDLPIMYDFIADVGILKARQAVDYFNAPGPIVKILPNLAFGNPITYGADAEECVYQNQSPVFTAPAEWVVASYPTDPTEILLSGYLELPENIAGKAAIVCAPAKDGTGRVVLFGTDITYRWQAHGAYFYLWNAILNWDNLP